MGITKHFQRSSPASSTQDAPRNPASSLFWPILVSNIVLSALSIANLGLISAMVAFLLDQKHNVHHYLISSPGLPFFLNVEPAHLWVDQGHTSNGVAGYGFFLGMFGMSVAWRTRKATVSHVRFPSQPHHSNMATGTFKASHDTFNSPASRHPVYPQRIGLRLCRNTPNDRSINPSPHSREHAGPKLQRAQMDARDMVQSCPGSAPCGRAHA
jgi:hypothetical protein